MEASPTKRVRSQVIDLFPSGLGSGHVLLGPCKVDLQQFDWKDAEGNSLIQDCTASTPAEVTHPFVVRRTVNRVRSEKCLAGLLLARGCSVSYYRPFHKSERSMRRNYYSCSYFVMKCDTCVCTDDAR